MTILPTINQLIANGINVWTYSGDIDGMIPVTSTRYSVNKLKLPVEIAWRPWYYNKEVGGYVVGPLSRQDLVSWKMSLEKRLHPVPDRTEPNVFPVKLNLPVVQPSVKPSEETSVLKSVVKEAGKTGDKPAPEKQVAKSVVKKDGKSGVKPDQENVLQTSQDARIIYLMGCLPREHGTVPST
ncbi:hypothetical protein L2E82_38268 [Cichorium intybus]|uniref:Uncharacterized protein n=1 Tax=Cichorium intybus TaxID=13427 RepID=A0ACB9AGS2_CICIN|nr:hypothetical protein L2E82_38268 [Cichorium intybus]